MADEQRLLPDSSILHAKNAEAKKSMLYKTIPTLSATGFKHPETTATAVKDESLYTMDCQVN